MAQSANQLQVVAQDAIPNQGFERVALFDAAGNPIDIGDLVARVEALEAADE